MKILQLAEMCRKLETEEEKVLPFFSKSLTPEEEEQVASVENEPPSQELSEVGGTIKSVHVHNTHYVHVYYVNYMIVRSIFFNIVH